MNDHAVIPDRGRELVFIGPAEKGKREDEERIGLGNEIASRFQVRDLTSEGVDLIPEVTVSLDRKPRNRELFGVFREVGFPSFEKRVRRGASLTPTVTREGLIIL